MLARFVWAFCVLTLFEAHAQSPRNARLRGEISGARPYSMDGLYVELVSAGGAAPTERIPVSSNGLFEAHHLRPGQYQVRVTDARGNVVQSSFVDVSTNGGEMAIRLQETPQERPAAGLVSLARLQHKVPKAARKEFEHSERAYRQGDLAASIEHLRSAVNIDPEYADGWLNLGARLSEQGKIEEAIPAFQKSIDLDPAFPTAYTNLAIAYVALGKYDEAEAAARRSLRLDSMATKGRMLLGIALIMREQYTDEAAEAFKRAAPDFPRAHIGLAQIAAHRSNINAAREHLRTYLATPQSPEHPKAAQWLAQLDKLAGAQGDASASADTGEADRTVSAGAPQK